MTLLLKQVFAFFKLLNSDKGTTSIALGIVCGMFLGFSPGLSLQTLVIFVLLFFFRIQMGAAFLTAVGFKAIAFGLDPFFDRIGGQVLELEALRPAFTDLSQVPLLPFTRFNNSIVMGSGVVALALALPLYWISKRLVAAYRDRVVARFEKTKFWKVLKATSFFQWYAKYEQLQG